MIRYTYTKGASNRSSKDGEQCKVKQGSGSDGYFAMVAGCSTEAGAGIYGRSGTAKDEWLTSGQGLRLFPTDGARRPRVYHKG